MLVESILVNTLSISRFDKLIDKHVSIGENSFLCLLHVTQAFQFLALFIFLSLRVDRFDVDSLHSKAQRQTTITCQGLTCLDRFYLVKEAFLGAGVLLGVIHHDAPANTIVILLLLLLLLLFL